MSSDAVAAFYNERFVTSQVVVTATGLFSAFTYVLISTNSRLPPGVQHAPFASAFQELLAHVPSKAAATTPAKYFGGAVEVRMRDTVLNRSHCLHFYSRASSQVAPLRPQSLRSTLVRKSRTDFSDTFSARCLPATLLFRTVPLQLGLVVFLPFS